MLKALGVSSLEALMDDAVPGRIRSDALDLPAGRVASVRLPPSCARSPR